MKSIKNRVFLVISLVIVLVFLITSPIQAKSFEIAEVEFEPYYTLNSILELPRRSIDIDGTSHDAKTVVHLPNGKAYQRSSVILDQLGKYKVVYRTTIEEQIYQQTYDFIVVDDTYTMREPNSSAYFGIDESYHDSGLNGLHVSLARGDTFEYNDIIDLTKLGKNEPFISMAVLPVQGYGTKDIKKLNIELIDIHRPENVLKIVGNAVDDDGGPTDWWSSNLYLQAGAEGRPTAGMEWVRNTLHVNNNWGYPARFSMYGMQNGSSVIGKEQLSFILDLESKQIFGPGGRGANFIIDLDDTAFVDIPWAGFTTGEVLLRITAEGYTGQLFNFVITKLADKDLSPEYVFDVTGPRITIDSPYEQSGQYPNAVTGYTYPIFNAESFDVYTRQSDLSVRIFYNYYTSQRYEVPIVNGRFETKRAGTYTIEYSSKDAYENETKKLIHVNTTDSLNPIISNISGDYDTEGFVGHRLNIASFEASGGAGGLTSKVYAQLGSEKFEINENTFRPSKPGNYKIVFEITDIVGQIKKVEYDLSVLESQDPIFLTDPWLPEYFIANKSYDLETLNAFDFIDQKDVEAQILVTDGKGSNQVVVDNQFTFTPNQDGQAIITYKAVSAHGETSLTFVVPVIVVYENGLNMEKYFDTNNLTVAATPNHISLKTINNENADFIFINPISAELLQLRFRIDPMALNFTTFKIILRDIKTGEQVHVSYSKNPNNQNIQIRINDELLAYEPIVKFNQGGELRLQYNNKNQSITFDGVSTRTVTENHLGEPFDGFESSIVYLEGAILNVSDNAAILMNNINGQLLSNDTEDFVKPQIYLNGSYQSSYENGKTATIYSALALDVLDPEVTAFLTVRAPNGNVVTSLDGTVLNNVGLAREYEVKLEQYGPYVVTYTARDAFGSGNVMYNYSLNVEDNVAPVITVEKPNVATAKQNELIEIQLAKSTDNVTETLKISTFVITPKGVYVSVTDEMKYTPTMKGLHTIRYFTMDEAGNTTFVDNVFEVK